MAEPSFSNPHDRFFVEQEGSQEALITILSYIASGAEFVTVEDLQDVVEELL